AEDTSRLQELLKWKLRGIPKNHVPDIRLSDILHCTPRTRLPHIPADLDLAFFFRNRGTIDSFNCVPLKEELGQGEDVTRAVWFYRLDSVRQFQRWHDGVRWNVALFTALLASSTLPFPLSLPQKHNQNQVTLSPAAVRFMTLYLSAVLEHHSTPSTSPSFAVREAFVRVWRTSNFDLFMVHKSWAKKALQREMKRLSKEWEKELDTARGEMGRQEYDEKVASFVGSLIPGHAQQDLPPMEWAKGGGGSSEDGREGDEDIVMQGREGNELLDALRGPYPNVGQDKGDGRTTMKDEEGAMVCDLRTAISCVQSVRPGDMLPVLIRL
ncbi:hypothetical protein BU25DRAFT_296379, partial [Macroventuria anomochaeta]